MITTSVSCSYSCLSSPSLISHCLNLYLLVLPVTRDKHIICLSSWSEPLDNTGMVGSLVFTLYLVYSWSIPPFWYISSCPYFITLSAWGWLLHNLLKEWHFSYHAFLSFIWGWPCAQKVVSILHSHSLSSSFFYPNQSQLSPLLLWRNTWYGCHLQGWNQSHLTLQFPDNSGLRQKSFSKKICLHGDSSLRLRVGETEYKEISVNG